MQLKATRRRQKARQNWSLSRLPSQKFPSEPMKRGPLKIYTGSSMVLPTLSSTIPANTRRLRLMVGRSGTYQMVITVHNIPDVYVTVWTGRACPQGFPVKDI